MSLEPPVLWMYVVDIERATSDVFKHHHLMDMCSQSHQYCVSISTVNESFQWMNLISYLSALILSSRKQM